jgi:hypothetical protein
MPPLLRRGILFVVVFREGGDGKRGGRMRGTNKETYKDWSLDAKRILKIE